MPLKQSKTRGELIEQWRTEAECGSHVWSSSAPAIADIIERNDPALALRLLREEVKRAGQMAVGEYLERAMADVQALLNDGPPRASHADLEGKALPLYLYESHQVFRNDVLVDVQVRPVTVVWHGVRSEVGATGPSLSFIDAEGRNGWGSADLFYASEADAQVERARVIRSAQQMGQMLPDLPRPTRFRDGTEHNPIDLEIEQLPGLGTARISSVGTENIYMERGGLHYYCKVHDTRGYEVGEWDFIRDEPLHNPQPKLPLGESLNDLLAKALRAKKEREALADQLVQASGADGAVAFEKRDGRTAIAGRDPSKPGFFRVTWLDESGPYGHAEAPTLRDAVVRALEEGYRPNASLLLNRDLDPETLSDDRVHMAATALQSCRKHGVGQESAVAELLCSLQYYCDRVGVSFETELARANRAYTHGTGVEDDCEHGAQGEDTDAGASPGMRA
ncbi:MULTISPECIES: hypothetical protein [unclassified Burkholderia]|uniref:hypothetical protein n=1 Tax=unclassified Burkholderia TaxID=2613784 RepID=UPI002AB24AB1|nr:MULTISPECIES: hypothetical protein [unclassified Burkholderia]